MDEHLQETRVSCYKSGKVQEARGIRLELGIQQSIMAIKFLSPLGHAHEGLLYSLKVVSISWKQLAMCWGG